jgi:DNA-binding transcriptional MerR regulator
MGLVIAELCGGGRQGGSRLFSLSSPDLTQGESKDGTHSPSDEEELPNYDGWVEEGLAEAARMAGMEAQGSRPIYSISAAARMVGVPVATLRTWEERYALVVPDRNASGHRLFSRGQVEQLRFVKMRMAEGMSAADAHRLLAEQMGTGLPVAAPDGHPPRLLILLAEHDPYAAELQEYFLKTEGFEVEVALGDEAARRSFLDDSPSLVVVELLISGGTGFSLCRFFKQDHDVPVVAVSVLECQDQAIEAGADAFLLKPLEPLQFVSTVRDLLGSSAFLLSPGQEVSHG